MPSLKTLASIVTVLSVVVPVAQAKTDYAYVANIAANTVSVINTTNNTVVKTIPVGDGPWGVAVNQAGSYAYVVNNHDTASGDSVSVISTATNTVVATIKVGSVPFGIAFAPNGTRAYVTNGNSNSVSVINTGTKVVTATVAVQSHPVGLAVMGNGSFVYVANDVSGSVSVISTLTNTVVATIPVGSNPIAVAISPDQSTAYVTNSGSNTISVIQTANNTVVNTINVSAGPFGAAVSPDGHWLYVANSNGNSGNLVTVIDTASQTVTATVVAGTGPAQVAFSEDSAFAYVSNITSNNVTVINTASRTVANTIAVGTAPIGVGVMGTVKVTTVAGGYVGDKGAATSAALNAPYSSVHDGAGNLYISDIEMHRVRKVTPAGVISTYLGTGICGYNGENIKASMAMTCYPNGLAISPAGDLIVADGNLRIRRITPTGIVSTIAGNGINGYTGDGGPAINAEIGQPFQLAYDAAGSLYFDQVGQCVVRQINTSGTISTVAGNGTCGYNGDGIPATTAQLNFPRGVAVDSSLNVYIGDTLNHRVRMVDTKGTISTFAGTGNAGFSGDGGLATSANIGNPRGLIIQSGALYISNAGRQRFRYVNLGAPPNNINTYAGSFTGFDGDGHSLLATEFASAAGIQFDTAGNPTFDDADNGRVRKATGGIVNTIAGGYLGDGKSATSAAFVFPEALAFDKANNLYVADWTGNRIRKVTAGKMSTIAGTGVSGYSGDGGLAVNALLNAPQGITVDSNGNVFFADTYNGAIRKIDTSGNITTFATNANFSYLLQMAADTANNLYVADIGSCVVWKITPAAVVSAAAGVINVCGYNGDGIAATTVQLNRPYSVAVDTTGNLFIADNGNNRIREVNTSGIISTVAGDGNCGNSGDDGPATAAEICLPYGVAVAKSGTIYLSDGNNRVRQIEAGTITGYAGAGYFGFNGDGLWPLLTEFDETIALALDSKSTLYVLDDVEHRVRKIQ
jgi:YVTN family beta-propeller protein